MPIYLPAQGRVHPQGEDAQGAQVRHHQADGGWSCPPVHRCGAFGLDVSQIHSCATASNSRLITMATDHVLLLIPIQSSHSGVALHLTLPSKGDRALPSTGNVHVPRAALAEPLRRAGARQRRRHCRPRGGGGGRGHQGGPPDGGLSAADGRPAALKRVDSEDTGLCV
jgi:hypothetical protein